MAYGYSMWPMAGEDQGYGRVLGTTSVQTTAGSTTQIFFNGNPTPFRIRIIDVKGIMTGAGAALDTMEVTDGTNSITDTSDLSALADGATFEAGNISDTYWLVTPGENLTCVTASAALCYVTVYFERAA